MPVPTSQPRGAPEPAVGAVLNGRFRISERVGKGLIGTVYKAVQEPLDRPVALKLFPARSGGRDYRARFNSVLGLTAKLKHPNTVKIIEYGEAGEALFVAMEFLPGVSLAEYLRDNGLLPWQSAVVVAQNVLRALREAHVLGVVHRDVKPQNVMLLSGEDPDSVKLLDFGLLTAFGPEGAVPLPTESGPGFLVGSPEYLPPEQARNFADPRSDLYALGVTLFEMVAGRLPFLGASFLDLVLQHSSEPVPRIAEIRPELSIPPDVQTFIDRCMAKAPADRFASADAALAVLRALRGVTESGPAIPEPSEDIPLEFDVSAPGDVAPVSEAADRTDQEPTAPQKPPPSPRPRVVIPALAGVLLAIVAAAAWKWARRTEVTPRVPSTAAAPVAVARPSALPGTATLMVRFHVDSEPGGATVTIAGRVVGKAPVVFEWPRGPDGIASPEVQLSLRGYQPLTIDIGGPGPDVVLKQKLTPISKPKIVSRVKYRQAPAAPEQKLAAPKLVELPPTPTPAPPPAPSPAPGVVTSSAPPSPVSPPVVAPQPAVPTASAPSAAPAARQKTVVAAVLDRDLLSRAPPHLSEVFRANHRRLGAVVGAYRVCVGVDGHVSEVSTVKTIPGADEDIAAGIREGWLFRPQRVPVCALYSVPVRIE